MGGETRNAETMVISGGSDIELGNNKYSVTDTFLRSGTEVTFTNTKDGVVPTEIFFSWKIWLLLISAAGAYFGLRIARRRRYRGAA